MKLPRYGPGARWYDVLSGERWLYRTGRIEALTALSLRPGNRLLDIGCGTGLNFAAVRTAIGPTGCIVGVDASPAMLAVAAGKAADDPRVRLIEGDAGDLSAVLEPGEMFDAVIFAYSLAVIPRWEAAWAQAFARLRPGGRIAVLDSAPPVGPGRVLAPLAWLIFLIGGVHPRRRVWRQVVENTVDVHQRVLRSGHVRLAVGTKPVPPARPESAR